MTSPHHPLYSSADQFAAEDDTFLYQGLPSTHRPNSSIASSSITLNDPLHVPSGEKDYGSTDALGSYYTPLGLSSGLDDRPFGFDRSRQPLRGKALSKGKRWAWWVFALALICLGIGVPVAIVSSHHHTTLASTVSTPASTSTLATSTSAAPTITATHISFLATGGGGSTVTSTDGTTQFIYNNSLGGIWNAIPFNDSAYPQDDVPPLNSAWDYSKNRIRGVNLGGWLNLEGFIVPAIFDQFINNTIPAVDEWTLAQNLDNVSSTAKQTTMETHYSTFITEIDFAQIAGAGLNWIRIPIPFWAIDTYPGEPYYTGQWPHLLNAITWARKYGLRINLDLHSCPGSQNGWDHSGRRTNQVNCMKGSMGIANAQRSLNHVRILAEFVSQPQYKNVIPMLGVMNEPLMDTTQNGSGTDPWMAWNTQVYQMIRGIGGNGSGNGPMILLSDGFMGQTAWTSFLTGADRIALDTHTYLCFTLPQTNASFATQIQTACTFGADFRSTQSTWGLNTGGEWSLAINDCGESINGVGTGTRYEGTFPGSTVSLGSCDEWTDSTTWNAERKAGFVSLAEAWMSATWNYFFWTWKIGAKADGSIPNPMWSYQLGLQEGYMPSNARIATSGCAASPTDWAGTLPATATGGAGAGALQPAVLASYTWPPVLLETGATTYQYTPTLKVFSMSVSTPTAPISGMPSTSYDAGNGWAQPTDTSLMYTPSAGAVYADAWNQVEPGGSIILKRASQPTPGPRRLP